MKIKIPVGLGQILHKNMMQLNRCIYTRNLFYRCSTSYIAKSQSATFEKEQCKDRSNCVSNPYKNNTNGIAFRECLRRMRSKAKQSESNTSQVKIMLITSSTKNRKKRKLLFFFVTKKSIHRTNFQQEKFLNSVINAYCCFTLPHFESHRTRCKHCLNLIKYSRCINSSASRDFDLNHYLR